MISPSVYKQFKDIVGKPYISHDPEVCQAYTLRNRGFHGAEARLLGTVPACVLLPKTTEQVSAILQICYQHEIPYIPASTFWFTQAGPRAENCLFLDLKRMNELQVDSSALNATVGPGVTYAQLQAEALKHGLYTMVPGGGSQASVVANHLSWGFSPLTYRVGMANRRILAAEWVLPDGEVVGLGSLATGDDPFWGECVGPDLRGLLRGSIGWMGSLGVVTKMCVRLFPFQPERLRSSGVSPETFLVLPTHRIRWYNFLCQDLKTLLEMMVEIGEAEIAAAVMRVPRMWRFIAKAESKEDFWEQWNRSNNKEPKDSSELLRVLLVGYTSTAQLEYEEKVLMAIAQKYGAVSRPAQQRDQSWIQSADSVSMWWVSGAFMSVTGQVDTIDCAAATSADMVKLKEQYTPPLVQDHQDPGWFQATDMGHGGYLEFLNYWDPRDSEEMIQLVDRYYHLDGPKCLVQRGALSFFIQTNSPLSLDGPHFGPHYDHWTRKVKEMLDPKGLSNPPGILDAIDQVIERAPWLKKHKDW
ncbi:MAG: hypothetical protein DRH11_13155 [Deltaproteobacteria bacterium]|nr:MAG: hypothetical protein DRH11_13155 [Deltaproteobacteria bacterium]